MTPEFLAAHLDAIQGGIAEQAARWKTGMEPLAFDEFCVALDGVPLMPRQHQVFAAPGLLCASDLLASDRTVMEWVLLFGKGSGKDWLAAKFISYLAYIVLSLNDPAKELGLAVNTPLAILNVAPSEDLARQVFFAYLRQFISTPIFAAFLPDPKHQILVDEIRFPQANLTLFSKHSRAAGLDGYNLLAWVMDEADEFLDNQKTSNAEVIHNVLRSSCNTRLRNRWIGMVISLSLHGERIYDAPLRAGQQGRFLFLRPRRNLGSATRHQPRRSRHRQRLSE